MKPALFCNTAIACALLLLPASGVQAQNLYRYQNDLGNTVIDYQVPPEFVHKGYEVLAQDGTIVRTVPRQLTAEELQALSEEELSAKRRQEEEERLRRWDESLLLRYSSIDDIEAARERALRELRIRISILKSNMRSLKQQIENTQAKAANIERSGVSVPVEMLQNIEDLQQEIQFTDRSVSDREVEIDRVAEDYQRDIERFELLLDLVELRRSQAASTAR